MLILTALRPSVPTRATTLPLPRARVKALCQPAMPTAWLTHTPTPTPTTLAAPRRFSSSAWPASGTVSLKAFRKGSRGQNSMTHRKTESSRAPRRLSLSPTPRTRGCRRQGRQTATKMKGRLVTATTRHPSLPPQPMMPLSQTMLMYLLQPAATRL